MFAYIPRAACIWAAILTAPLLTGCANYIFKTFDIDNRGESLSLDAKQRLVLVTEKGGKTRDRKIVCAEPSPDALSATAASGSAAITFPTLIPGAGDAAAQKGDSASGAASAARSESVASIAMRTQTIQLLRDGYYRLCEAYMNGAIDQHQYNVVLVNIDKLMVTLLGVDGIAGTRNVAPVSINAAAPATSAKTTGPGGAGSETEVKPSTGGNVTNNYTMEKPDPPGAVQSEAIANIILAANSHIAYPGLCISLLASGELRLDNPGQYTVLKSCDYLLKGVARKVAHGQPRPAPTYKVSDNAADAQSPSARKSADKDSTK